MTAATRVADSRWVDRPNYSGFNDFVESDLQEIIDLSQAVLSQLPSIANFSPTSEDAPVPFDPNEMPDQIEAVSTSEAFAQSANYIGTLVLRVKALLADARLAPIISPSDDPAFSDWLEEYIGASNAENGAIAVLDLSLVPSDVLHLVIAVISRLVFEALVRYRRHYDRVLPSVLVLEEAHTFIQRTVGESDEYVSPARMCRETFERIAREGRKFGLGMVLSSQRPSELSSTVLAQCNTFLLHRIVNDRDQDLVARLVPDNLAGLLRELPSLPSQQAVLLGWAAPVPVLVEMRHLPTSQRPRSEDPRFWDVWTQPNARDTDWSDVAAEWTGLDAQ